MATLRPGASGTHRYRASADFSNLHTFSPLNNRSGRPASMMFESSENGHVPKTAEAQGYEQWLADISYYESTLGEMAAASLDQNFKEELGAIEQWFSVLSDAERTSALYALLGQATQVQIRFLIMVLQQKAQQDPLSDILSPANFNKDAMSVAAGQPSTHSTSPSIYKLSHGNSIDQAAIQQMFPDAAAALASQRAELNRKKNAQIVIGGSSGQAIQTTLNLPMKEEGSRTPWTPSFRKTLDSPVRPKSAEPQNTTSRAGGPLHATPLRNARTDLNATSVPYSPFGEPNGNSWASMTNTPATAMFPQSAIGMESLHQRLAAAEVPRAVSASGQSGSGLVLESDVRQFRRQSRSPMTADNLNLFPSSPLLMYDENGQVMSPQAAQQLISPTVSRHAPSAINTPSQGGAWLLVNPSSGGFVFPSSSPAQSMEGYTSDVSNNRRRGPQPKPVENPTDIKLLNDIPAWLRQLRLHKYTEELKHTKWQDLVKMNEEELEAKGILALGARRKLLKAFEVVNQAIADGQLQA